MALSKEKFLILGRKGTGKSILAEFISKRAKQESNWFCQICSYKDFKFHELVFLKTNDITPNEYISIWEWVIVLEMAKLCLGDYGIPESQEKGKLRNFISSNFYSLDLNASKIVEITKSNKFSGSLRSTFGFSASGEHSNSGKYSTGTYLDYLEDLKDTVFNLLQQSQSMYTLIYDELDDRFRNDELYKDSIISLLKATDKTNMRFLRSGINAKVMLLLRTDIFSVLNDPDLNKITIDNSIEINWGHRADMQSPLR